MSIYANAITLFKIAKVIHCVNNHSPVYLAHLLIGRIVPHKVRSHLVPSQNAVNAFTCGIFCIIYEKTVTASTER